MTTGHDKHETDAVDQVPAADGTDETGEEAGPYLMQAIITIALFGAFVAFALFCLPFYIFN
ncbi:MAG: hypothetical protein IPL36_05735 [Nigerium sp.]|nr:hypothetical protein [Nigerium sp.]